MPDAGQGGGTGRDDKAPSDGRQANADKGRPEPYPPVRQDDAIDRTAPTDDVPIPREGPRVGTEGSRQDGFAGPQGDPAEGKP